MAWRQRIPKFSTCMLFGNEVRGTDFGFV